MKKSTKTGTQKRTKKRAKKHTHNNANRFRIRAAIDSVFTWFEKIKGLPGEPIPKAKRDEVVLQVLAAHQCILRGQAITHQWRAVVDAVNITETMRRAGFIRDPSGSIADAADAILRAIERRKANDAPHALLDGIGIGALEAVLGALPKVLDSIDHRQFCQLLRETDLRLREAALRKSPQLRVIPHE